MKLKTFLQNIQKSPQAAELLADSGVDVQKLIGVLSSNNKRTLALKGILGGISDTIPRLTQIKGADAMAVLGQLKHPRYESDFLVK